MVSSHVTHGPQVRISVKSISEQQIKHAQALWHPLRTRQGKPCPCEVRLGVHGCAWVCMGAHGCAWICMAARFLAQGLPALVAELPAAF